MFLRSHFDADNTPGYAKVAQLQKALTKPRIIYFLCKGEADSLIYDKPVDYRLR